MGQKHSSSGSTSSTSHHSSDHHSSTHHPHTATAPPPPEDPKLKLVGVPVSASKESLLVSQQDQEALIKLVRHELPYNFQEKWLLLYASRVHGKSFTRLVERISNKGATLIIIKEGVHPDGGASDIPPRTFGGFCTSPWLTVADREKAAKSHAAAKSRALRNGLEVPSERPKNQDVQFFGESECFVFANDVGSGGKGPNVYRARTNLNSNFMYLFDTHPDESRIGIAMGGKPNYHAWFLDNWLDKGHCRGSICTTFGNPALSPREEFIIDQVEVYAVDPESYDEAEVEQEQEHTGGVKNTVLSKNPNRNVDMMLLELNGTHQFRCDNPRVADPNDEDDEGHARGTGGCDQEESAKKHW